MRAKLKTRFQCQSTVSAASLLSVSADVKKSVTYWRYKRVFSHIIIIIIFLFTTVETFKHVLFSVSVGQGCAAIAERRPYCGPASRFRAKTRDRTAALTLTATSG